MVPEPDDMHPVTRGELREELHQLEQRFDLKLEKLDQKLDQKLELWTGAMLARIEPRLMAFEQRLTDTEQRLLSELARHARAIQDSLTGMISAVDEKYTDLPGRVVKLEHEVFVPRPTGRARTRRRKPA